MIVGTAPSMDGYASNTSSMISAGHKGNFTQRMFYGYHCRPGYNQPGAHENAAGWFGRHAGKYISICEWRISNLITGEYYCEQVASLVRRSLKRCIQSAEGLLTQKDPEAIRNVLEGLILSGIAMSFAGVSRPASGIEHYFSHVWEMRAIGVSHQQ
jgi:glycerol-1-phosphate dehydrogenase [NAD(P)+]